MKKTKATTKHTNFTKPDKVCPVVARYFFRAFGVFRDSTNSFRLDRGLFSLTATIFLFATRPASAQSSNDIPPLQPALPEIPPTLWEQHSVLIVVFGVLMVGIFAVAILWLLQPKPAIPVAIGIQTRRELEALQQRVEDGRTLSEITRCLRRYIVFAFGLPPLELTTREFCRTILTNEKIGPELSSHFVEFLLRCDEQKFAPSGGPPLTGTAERALQLLELGEVRRVHIRQAAVGQTAQTA